MKFIKTLAAAAVLAAVSVPALAAIKSVNDGSSELFLAVGDENGSFILDTGVTLDTLLNNPASFSRAVASTAWTNYSAADTNLFDGASNKNTGTRWALFVYDGSGLPEFDLKRVVTTLGKNLGPANVTFDGNTLDGSYASTGLVGAQAGLTGAHATQANGTSYNLLGTNGYAGSNFFRFGISANTLIGNKVGDSSALYFIRGDDADNTDGLLTVLTTKLNLTASFDGTTLNVVTAAVPEPESYALMVAGLAAVGFVARRRRAA